MKQLLLIIVLLFGFFSTSIAQKSQPTTTKNNSSQRNSLNCPLTVSIQDNIPSSVCSELLKTLVAVTPACTDTNAVNYSWSSSVGGVFSTSRTTTFNLPEFLVATPVTFTVTVVEGNETVSANYTITVKPRPSRPTLTPFGTIILCDNNSITLTSSACTGGSTTIWSNGATAVSSITVPAIGGTYFKVACERNGCVSDSTAAAALTTGTVTASPTVINRTICEGTAITTGNGLQAQLVNCGTPASGTYTYTGPTVGYDQGYRNTGGIDPKVTVPTITGNISNIKVSVTWRKQKGGFQNSCGVGDTESWPYHNETQFRVQSPSGKIITLVNTNTYGGSNNPTVTTVFEDGATPVNFYSPPVSGTFAPAQPLSGFIGENPTGTWTLLPYDAVWKDPLCVSGFSVTFTADAQVGTLTWWDAPTGGNQVGTGSEFIPTNTAAGTHTYYAQGQCAKGCPSVRTPSTLTINPTPQAPVISVSVPEVNGVRNVCGGESVTLTATGCNNGGTVKWNSSYNGTNFATGSSYTFIPSFSNSSNISQTFTAACEGSNLCRSVNSNSLTIVVKQKPAQPTISGPGSTVCINSTVTLTASACSGGTLGWTGNRSGSSINFVLTSAVNIKVACTVNGCTSDSSNVYSITTLPKPATPTVNASQIQALCLGDGVTLSSNCANGTTTKWTGNLTGSPITVYPTTTRSYRASCLGANGCPSDSSAALTIVVLPKTKPTITGSTFICGTGAGISVTLTATGCSGVGETVMWRNEDTGTTYTETISQTKTFRAVCIRGGYCVSDSSDIFTVQYRNKPSQPTITPPQNTTICQGTSVSLTASGCAGGTLGWTGGLSGQTVSVSPNVTKSYRVACTVNGCTSDSSSVVTITVNPSPSFVISSDKSSICASESATLTATGCSGTLLWSNNATSTSITVSPSITTTYTATCTLGSCSLSQQTTITALSTSNVTASGILQCGQTVTLTANNVPSGSTIQWRKDGVDIANATTNTLVINSAGNYDFTSYKIENSSINNAGAINEMYFLNTQIGFYVSSGGIFKTTNGGTSWNQVQSSVFFSITFVNSMIGWAVGENGRIAKTIDGGNTWVVSNINSYSYFQKIKFRDINNGVIVGGFSEIFYTNNGGITWTLSSGANLSSIPTYSRISFVPNTSVVYALSSYNTAATVVKSTNNGASWTQVAINFPVTVRGIAFSSTNIGWIACGNGSFLKTIDGGNSWQIQSSSFTDGLNDIQFVDEQNGFTAGNLLRTTNGGLSWKALNQNIGSTTLYFVDKNNGWWANTTLLYKYTTPQCSTTPLVVAPPTRPNAPTITPPTNSTICQGSSVTLSATGCTGGTYAWTGGLTGTSISVTPSSTRAYKVACTLNTCVSDSSSAVIITVNPKPAQPTINQINPSICLGQSVLLSVIPVSGATYAWTGGLTGTGITISPTVTKTYKVATTINGCVSDSTTVTVSVTSVQTPLITLGGEVCTNNLPVKIWDKSISTPSGSSINALIKTNDGGMFTVIQEPSNTTIAKLDATGTTVWSRALFSVPAGTVKINAAVATTDGGYLLAGKSNSASVGGDVSTPARLGLFNNPTDDFWILKIDANGVKQWDKRYGGNYNDEANDIIQTSDGGYLLGGITQSDQSGDVSENGYFNENSFWSVKIDANGIKQWDKRFIPQYLLNMNGGATLKSVQNTPDGGYLLGGHSKPPYEPINNTVQTNDYFVVKLNASGGKQWEKLYNNSNAEDYLNSMQPTSDGGFLLVGNTSTANGNVWLVKINASGVRQWSKEFGGSDSDYANTIVHVSGENNFLIGGTSSSGISGDKTEASKGMSDLWVIKVKSDGTKIWDKTIGGSGLDYLYKTTFDSNNDIILGAFTASPTSGDRTGNGPGAWFVKIASNCSPQNAITICKGDSITLKSGCTGITTWSNGLLGSVITVKPVVSTSYTATCTVNGCMSSASPTFTATVSTPAIPNITPPTNSTICQGNSVMLSALGCIGGTFTWTGGLTGTSISVSPSLTKAYKVACTLNSCTSDSSSAITIIVNSKPIQPTISQTNPSICIGQNVTLYVVPVSGATYTWTGGLTGTSISTSPLATKIYKVSATIAGCLSDSASVIVNVNSENPPTITLGSESCNNILPSKVWDKTVKLLGDSEVKKTITTTDGGTFSILANGSAVHVMAKFDNNGNTQWTREINVPNDYAIINTIVQTVDGGYLLGGRNGSYSVGGDVGSPAIPGLYSISSPDFWILKIDANGVRQWDKRYGGQRLDEIFDILKTSDGGYLLGGVTNSPSGYDISDEGSQLTTDYWVVKIDVTGNKAWDKRFVFNSGGQEAYNNELTSLLNTNDGGYLLGGHGRSQYNPARPSYVSQDYYLVKINSTGTKQWDKLYDNNSNETLTSMQKTSDGGFILVGNTTVAGGNIWTVKINSSGTKQWDRQYGGTGNDQASVIKAVPNENNFIIAGSSTSGISGDKSEVSKGGQDIWILKIKTDGIKIWDKTIGGDRTDYANSLALNVDGSIVVGGSSNSSVSGDKSVASNQQYSGGLFVKDSWLVKFASNCPQGSSALIALGDSLILKANSCAGTINWSNGMTGSSVIIKPVINTIYTATCSTTCTSPPGNSFNVTVSTTVCETIKSGSWTDPTTWSCNRTPTATDDVIINAGHIITNNGGVIRAKSLNYRGGQLQISSTSNLILGN